MVSRMNLFWGSTGQPVRSFSEQGKIGEFEVVIGRADPRVPSGPSVRSVKPGFSVSQR